MSKDGCRIPAESFVRNVRIAPSNPGMCLGFECACVGLFVSTENRKRHPRVGEDGDALGVQQAQPHNDGGIVAYA